MIYAVKPGDGSAREQAASCQKVLGGFANIAKNMLQRDTVKSYQLGYAPIYLLQRTSFRSRMETTFL